MRVRFGSPSYPRHNGLEQILSRSSSAAQEKGATHSRQANPCLVALEGSAAQCCWSRHEQRRPFRFCVRCIFTTLSLPKEIVNLSGKHPDERSHVAHVMDVAINRSSVSRDGIHARDAVVFYHHSGDHAFLITSEMALAEPRVSLRCRYRTRRPRSDLYR
jgi:hypothetical protein